MRILTFILFLTLVSSFWLEAQTISSNDQCKEGEVTIRTQNFDKELIAEAAIAGPENNCGHVVASVLKMGFARIWLQKKNSSGVFVDVNTSPVESRFVVSGLLPDAYGLETFTNLSKGVYRGRVQVPETYDPPGSCTSTSYFSTAGAYLGKQAEWSSVFFTDEMIIGAPKPSDIDFSFVDLENDPFEQLYDLGESPTIDASASKHYDIYFLAIFETGSTYNRYSSIGWQSGTLGIYNLDDMWPWDFVEDHSYEVQFVIDNRGCKAGWNNLNRTFGICPENFPFDCKLGETSIEGIKIGPNPANQTVNIYNFDPRIDQGYTAIISDITGKPIRQLMLDSDQIDVSSIPNGIYVVRILKGNSPIFTSKLVVSH
ncbi:MAG: T9SS type A sorting domain-containing protein [Bacteroidetes bacterium]|jgi:hypothetical protein|nr:T9SS type A sorting domain-containing protein [Bacteroidota bacterium]